MLENIAYLGHELTGVSFELMEKEPRGEGFYNYSVEITPDVSVVSDEKLDTPIHTIRISLISKVKGFGPKNDSEDREEVFNLEIKFDILFELEGDSPTKKLLDDNQWYFVNFGHVASKELAYSILDNSTLKGTYLPSHRIGQKD